MDTVNTFSGKLLRGIRKEAGFTQAELARRVNISRETIIAIEKEHPRTIQSLELDIVRRWWKACHIKVSSQTKHTFVDYIMQFLKL